MDPKTLGVLEGALKCLAAIISLIAAWAALKKPAPGAASGLPIPRPAAVIIAIFCVVVAGFFTWFLFFRPKGDALSDFLAKRDPITFSWSADGRYKIARVLVDRNDLESNTKFAETLQSTQTSFDLLAISAGVFQSYLPAFEKALERGVRIRILLLDTGPATTNFYDALFSTPNNDPVSNRAQTASTLRCVENLNKKINIDRDRYKGNLNLRWLKTPMLYSMWLKDAADKHDPAAHVCVFSYRGSSWDACFRVGKDCPELIESLSRDFEVLWQASSENLSK